MSIARNDFLTDRNEHAVSCLTGEVADSWLGSERQLHKQAKRENIL